MVCGRRDADPELFDLLRQIAIRVKAIELAQDHGRHLDDVESNLKDDHDSFWDEFHEKIDYLEKSDFSWHLRIRKKVVWPIKKIV